MTWHKAEHAAENLMNLMDHVDAVDQFLKAPVPLPNTGTGYLKAREHFAVVRKAEATRIELVSLIEHAKRAFVAAANEAEGRK